MRARPYGRPLAGETVRLIAATSGGPKGGWPPRRRSWRPAARARAASRPAWLSAARSPAPRRWWTAWRLTGGQEAALPSAQGRGRDAQCAREYLQVFTPQQAQHRVALALARHPPASTQTHAARRLRSRWGDWGLGLRVAAPFRIRHLRQDQPLRRRTRPHRPLRGRPHAAGAQSQMVEPARLGMKVAKARGLRGRRASRSIMPSRRLSRLSWPSSLPSPAALRPRRPGKPCSKRLAGVLQGVPDIVTLGGGHVWAIRRPRLRFFRAWSLRRVPHGQGSTGHSRSGSSSSRMWTLSLPSMATFRVISQRSVRACRPRNDPSSAMARPSNSSDTRSRTGCPFGSSTLRRTARWPRMRRLQRWHGRRDKRGRAA